MLTGSQRHTNHTYTHRYMYQCTGSSWKGLSGLYKHTHAYRHTYIPPPCISLENEFRRLPTGEYTDIQDILFLKKGFSALYNYIHGYAYLHQYTGSCGKGVLCVIQRTYSYICIHVSPLWKGFSAPTTRSGLKTTLYIHTYTYIHIHTYT